MKRSMKIVLSVLILMSFMLTSLGFTSIAVKSIKLNTASVKISVGKTYRLKVIITPANATNKKVTFSSANKNIATVSSTGDIKGIRAGNTVITVSSASNKKAVAKCNVTISKLVPIKYSMYLDQSDIDENAERIKVWLEKSGLNVQLKVTGVPEDDFDQKISLLAASDELPDIISRLDKYATYKNLISSGMLLKLDSLLEQNAPNFIKRAKQGGYDYKYFNMFLSGSTNTYHLPVLSFFEKNIVPMNIRIDLFEKEGIAAPKTADEFYNALKTLKQKYPDKYGFMCRASWAYMRFFKVMFGAFDVKPGETPEVSQNYKQMLKFAAKLYKEGLIDKEFATANEDAFVQRMNAGNILTEFGTGAYIVSRARTLLGITPEDDQKAGASTETVNAYREKVMKILKPIQIPVADGKRPIYDPRGNVSKNGFVFSAKIKEPDRAVKLVDYLYSDEGALLGTIGIEGIHYKKSGEEIAFLDTANAATKYKPENFKLVAALMLDRKYTTLPKNNPMMQPAYEASKGLYASLNEIYNATEEQRQRMDELNSILEGKFEEYFTKFVMGLLDVDKDWDAYVKDVQAAGLTELETLKKSTVVKREYIVPHMAGANSPAQP